MRSDDEFDFVMRGIHDAMSLEELCGIFNQHFKPHLALSAEHPLCCIAPAAGALNSAAFRKGYASAAASVPYPPKEAVRDAEQAGNEVRFCRLIIEKSVNRALNSSLSDAQTLSALTLKAALAGAFTKENE
jgi:hypothetical protein